ncbi:hypothetical protein [Thermobifida halotolerans]|uniref:hypothetical protein n=1 Tax=Thermobifida halotolerans TaxID=483545 RepID=UPI000AD1B65B|nr:hypothetical protein [Thermobifida halotolerans]
MVVGLVAGGVALVVVAVAVVLILDSRPTRISDLADLHDSIEAEYETEPFLGVGEIDGRHTVYVSMHVYGVHGAGELRGNADRVLELVWEEVPGSFEQAAVSLVGDSDAPFVRSMTTGELREEFGSRPGGLEPVETNGREPTLHRAGECSRTRDYCNAPAEALVSENTRALVERACREVDWRGFPAEPIQIRNHDQERSGAESSMTYLLSPPTSARTDFVTVAVLGGRDAFLEVSCLVDGDAAYETYTRADYEDAAG